MSLLAGAYVHGQPTPGRFCLPEMIDVRPMMERKHRACTAAGDLEPTEGEARRSHTLRVGRYAQHFVDALQMDSNPVEYLLNKYPKVPYCSLLGIKPQCLFDPAQKKASWEVQSSREGAAAM